MLLSPENVRACLQNGSIRLTPFDESRFKEGSYSFSLGSRVSLMKAGSEIILGQAGEYEEHELSEEGYLLMPGAFAIFYTREQITLANNILCLLSTRGSVAKVGIDMLHTSLVVEPGSDNVLALETYNHCPRPVRFLPGVPVVKGVFFQISTA